MLAADQLSGAGIAAGSTIASAPRVHHTRPPTRGPHDGPHDRRLARVARDGAVAGSGEPGVQVLPALCQVVVRRGEGLRRGCQTMAEQFALGFAGLLRRLRARPGRPRRNWPGQPVEPAAGQRLGTGIHRTAHKDTALLLARALSLAVPVRALFVAAARSRGPAGVLAAWRGAWSSPGLRAGRGRRTGLMLGAFHPCQHRPLGHDPGDLGGGQRPITDDHRYARPSARGGRAALAWTGGRPSSASNLEIARSWVQARGGREAAWVIGRRWAVVHPGRTAPTLPLLAARHRHTVPRTDR